MCQLLPLLVVVIVVVRMKIEFCDEMKRVKSYDDD
jgi:hypothetical protein